MPWLMKCFVSIGVGIGVVAVEVGDLCDSRCCTPRNNETLGGFILYCSGSQPGVLVPLGVREEATGGTQRAHRGTKNSKNLTQMKLIWVEFLIWGYVKGIHFWFGGTQRGTILIWGYTSTKRLRAPALLHFLVQACCTRINMNRKMLFWLHTSLMVRYLWIALVAKHTVLCPTYMYHQLIINISVSCWLNLKD